MKRARPVDASGMGPETGFLDGVEPPPARWFLAAGGRVASARFSQAAKGQAGAGSVYLGNRIEALLEERHGLKARYRAHAALGVPTRGRRYLRYDFVCREAADRSPWLSLLSRASRRSFFVKQGISIGKPALEQFLTDHPSPGFHTPFFYGAFGGRSRKVLVWEFVEGAHPHLPMGSVEAMAPVVEAVAAINSVPDDLVRAAGALPRLTPWIVPIAEEAELFLRSAAPPGSSAQMLRQLESFARSEGRIISRFAELGDRFLTHHDLKRENLLCPRGRTGITVLDWSSAAVSAPGTGLRFLSHWEAPSRAALADHYIQCMARSGHKLRLDDVLFAIEGVAVLKTLRKGLAAGNSAIVRNALTLFARFRDRLSAQAHWLVVAGAAC